MKITVIGCGRLGAPYAAGLAALGHEVLGLDTNAETAALLQAGKPPFAEPGLAEAITDGAATGRLTFTSSYANAAAHADIHFIAVATPQANGSAHHDLGDVFAAAESLAREITRDTLVVLKSSVPAGTTAKVKARMMALVPAGVTVEVAASPDFMREAHSIADVRRPTRIVLGVEPGGKSGDDTAAGVGAVPGRRGCAGGHRPDHRGAVQAGGQRLPGHPGVVRQRPR